MEIIPAIDLRGGRCVRLFQGDYARETVFADDPAATALHWQSLGAPRLHVVDLDGAREGEPRNLEVVERIVAAVDIPVQLGGGIRTAESARRAFDAGVQRVIVGTAALEPETAERLAEQFGDGLAAGIDARDGFVAVKGWTETTQVRATDLARRLVGVGIGLIVFTDIATDGALVGPNVAALREMVGAVQASVIASGGIATPEDVRAVRRAGAGGAIIGMALYTGKLDLKEALEAACSQSG